MCVYLCYALQKYKKRWQQKARFKLTRSQSESDRSIPGLPRTTLMDIAAAAAAAAATASATARRTVLVKQIAHTEISGMLDQQLDDIAGTVHNRTHLLEAAVDQRNAIPFENLIAIGGSIDHGIIAHCTRPPLVCMCPRTLSPCCSPPFSAGPPGTVHTMYANSRPSAPVLPPTTRIPKPRAATIVYDEP